MALGTTDAAAVNARPPRLLTDRWRLGLGKSPWLVTIPEAYGGRLATEATMEPSATVNWNQGAKIPDERAGFYRAEGWGREGYPIGR